MKITYKNTALGLMDNPGAFDFGFPPDMVNKGKILTDTECVRLGNGLLKSSVNLKNLCYNIQLVKHSFWDAYSKARSKIAKILESVEIEEGGVLITEGNPFTHTYFYYVKTYIREGAWTYDLLFMDFSKASCKPSYSDAVVMFCPLQRVDVTSKIQKGDGGFLPLEATVKGLQMDYAFKPGIYNIRNVVLHSNGTMQVMATEETTLEFVCS